MVLNYDIVVSEFKLHRNFVVNIKGIFLHYFWLCSSYSNSLLFWNEALLEGLIFFFPFFFITKFLTTSLFYLWDRENSLWRKSYFIRMREFNILWTFELKNPFFQHYKRLSWQDHIFSILKELSWIPLPLFWTAAVKNKNIVCII